MNPKSYYTVVYFFCTLLIGILIGSNLLAGQDLISLYLSPPNNIQKLNQLVDYIEDDYIGEINIDSILEGTIKDITNHLDPHSIYLSPENALQSDENTRGNYVGLGIQFLMLRDTLTVIRVLDDSPAQSVGIQTGDRLLIVNQDTIFDKNISNKTIVSKLKGVYKPLSLSVYRKREKRHFTLDLKSDEIKLKDIPTSYMINDTLGYIQISEFNENVSKDFTQAISSLLSQGMEELIVDLRNNPGGLLEEAIAVADEFLTEDKLIITVKQKEYEDEIYYAHSSGIFENKPVNILMNENSASASEVVAGALQDNDIGTIIGRRSFGKGLIQQDKLLGDGSRIRLTIGKYYTPTGRYIQRPYGIDKYDYYNDYRHRFDSGEMKSADSITIDSTNVFKTPKGKTVYGGGGIIPDVYIPEENINHTALQNIMQSSIVNTGILDFMEQQNWYPTTIKEIGETNITTTLRDTLIQQIKPYIPNPKYLSKHTDLFDFYLRANIIWLAIGEQASIQYRNTKDPMILKVLFD